MPAHHLEEEVGDSSFLGDLLATGDCKPSRAEVEGGRSSKLKALGGFWVERERQSGWAWGLVPLAVCQIDREPDVTQNHRAEVLRGPLARGGRTGRHDLL